MDELLIHRIFRANSFLIEEGLKLQKGEKYFSSEQLQRIDLYFIDRFNKPTFIELKWSGFSETQMSDYRSLVDKYFPDNRLIWLVPKELFQTALNNSKKYNIEVKEFDKNQIENIHNLQVKAEIYKNSILGLLNKNFKIKLYGEDIVFDNAISATYFEGIANTDKGKKKIINGSSEYGEIFRSFKKSSNLSLRKLSCRKNPFISMGNFACSIYL